MTDIVELFLDRYGPMGADRSVIVAILKQSSFKPLAANHLLKMIYTGQQVLPQTQLIQSPMSQPQMTSSMMQPQLPTNPYLMQQSYTVGMNPAQQSVILSPQQILTQPHMQPMTSNPTAPSTQQQQIVGTQPTTEKNITEKKACKKWEKCLETSNLQHMADFFHPCKYGAACRHIGNQQHCNRFVHPCKKNAEFKDKSAQHRVAFTHK